MTLYIYKVIREHMDGSRVKREKSYTCFEPKLKVGGLYVHLGTGFPRFQRVLGMTTKEVPD